jgi:hypothetical protein
MTRILPFAAFLFLCASTPRAAADLVAGWDFAGLPATTVSTFTPPTIPATVGSATLDVSSFSLGTPQGTAPERSSFGGSILNAFPGGDVLAGQALALASSTANGKSAIFSFSMLGYEDLIISFATRGTSTGFNTHLWSWSTDGITYTPVADNTAVTATTFEIKSVDFSAVSALANAPAAYLMLTLSGATSTSGNNRFDNIQFNAQPIPEPSVAAFFGGLGMLALVMASKRR